MKIMKNKKLTLVWKYVKIPACSPKGKHKPPAGLLKWPIKPRLEHMKICSFEFVYLWQSYDLDIRI